VTDQLVRLNVQSHTAVVEINRPGKHNALSRPLLSGLLDSILAIRSDRSIRAVVLCSSGETVFCAGGDISEMAAMSVEAANDYLVLGRSCATELELLPLPVIAAVHGHALGGGLELIMACDFVIGAESAEFALPEVKLGITPGFGGIPRLIRRVGFARAKWMVLSGERIDARVAREWSLVNKVAPTLEVRSTALAAADRFSRYSSIALAMCKQSLHGAAGVSLDEGLRREQENFLKAFDHTDRLEGMTAFTERRSAVFL
jgi:enoyl-CoA hydratase